MSVKNCLLKARLGEKLFTFSSGGEARAHLNGYAIIPIEEYNAIMGATGLVEEDHWPCAACRAIGPTGEGHDPCIANLPGVIHACCGHGVGAAYAMFSDGRVIRGHFEPAGASS